MAVGVIEDVKFEDLEVNGGDCWVRLIVSLKGDMRVKMTLGFISDANS